MAKARFFYALRPDPAAADALAALARRAAARWGGRALVAADIHLTLAFVGMRALAEQPTLEAILHGMPSHPAPPSPPLALTRLGSFGHGVLWLAPSAQAGDSTAFAHTLAQEIRRRLHAAGIGFDARALELHATLVRGAHGFDRASTQAGDRAPAHMGGRAPTHETDEPPLAAEPIVVRRWSLALGAAGPESTPRQRYRWSAPPLRESVST